MNVLVTGGTGALGREVVTQLRDSGHSARILSRKPAGSHVSQLDADWVQGDLATGAGLEIAVRGIDAVVHAGSASADLRNANATDVVGTRRLLAMAREARVPHMVYVSIVGMEGIPHPYFKHKLAAEAVVRENIVPWSILRATQFHTLMEIFLGTFSTLPRLAIVPFKWQFQPVDTRDVAARLIAVATGPPSGMLPEYGGPEVRDFKSIAQAWLAARKSRKRLVNLWLPFKFNRLIAQGQLTCPDHKVGTITFEQYLTNKYPPPT